MSKDIEKQSSESSIIQGELPDKKKTEEYSRQIDNQNNNLSIKHKIIVLSGKGGVGKSTVAANIAVALSMKGKKVGLMDIDIHGPSIPKILGLEGIPVRYTKDGILPLDYNENLKVISVGFLLQDKDNAIIWRVPLKHSLIKQFLTDVKWGSLDYLIVDCPPGTGDEPLSVIQLLENPGCAIVVTTPQDVALADVRKSITFCRVTKLPVLGVVENMSGFICPHCGERVDIFKSGGGERMASEMGVNFIGRVPIEPKIVESGDSGRPFMEMYTEMEAANAFEPIIEKLLRIEESL